MGGSSSSKSSSANNQRQITTTADNNQGVVASAGGDLAIEVLDGGAIESAFDFGMNALDEVTQFGQLAIESLADDNQEFYQGQQKALGAIATASRSETAQQLDGLTKYFFGALVVFAVVGGIAYVKGRG